MTKRTLLSLLFLSTLGIILYTSCAGDNTGEPPKPVYNQAEETMLLQGQNLAVESMKVFKANLSQALADSGVMGAIPFCKGAAQGITEEMSQEEGVSIRRTSHKVRNLKNAPDGIDKLMADYFNNFIEANKELKPVLIPMNERKQYRGYYPILMQGMCASCHGVVEKEITPETYDLILKQYPTDQAVNFFQGSLRGMWVVTFDQDPAIVKAS